MKRTVLIYMMICLVAACGGGDTPGEEPLVSRDYIEVAPNLQLLGDGQVTELKVTANCGWTITKSADWLTVNPTSGYNSETVKVSAGKNPTGEARYATLTVRGGTAPAKDVMVTQAAGTVEPEAKTLTVDVSAMEFVAEGGTKSFTIAGNTSWTISKPDWCLLSLSSGSGNKEITVTAEANKKHEQRTGHIVVTDSDATAPSVIAVTQEANQEPTPDDNLPPA